MANIAAPANATSVNFNLPVADTESAEPHRGREAIEGIM